MKKEIWKPVPGYVGKYEVSSWGRVKSLSRVVEGKCGRGRRLYPERFKAFDLNKGYHRVSLFKGSQRERMQVHVLVMLVFVGPKPEGMEVNHIDGNKLNNRLDNLEYCTRSENTQHALQLGLRRSMRGENNHQAVLNWDKVRAIRAALRAGGVSQKELGRRYGVDGSTIWLIWHDKKWVEDTPSLA